VEGQFGPTFPELRVIAHTTLKEGSLFFTMGTVGYLLGSVVMGYLFDKRTLNRDLLMFFSTCGYGVINVIVPWCGIYEVMVIIHVIKGAFGGALDTCKYVITRVQTSLLAKGDNSRCFSVHI
jgi:MFS family permease